MSNKIGFSLRKITTQQFAIIDSAFTQGDDVQFSINSKYGINDKDKMIVIFVSPAFYQNDKPFLLLELACHYSIVDETWENFKSKDKTKLTVPLDFIRHLIMIAIGTSRGVLHSKTEDTSFNNFIVPTVNVTDIVKSSVSFPLSPAKQV